MKDAEATAVQTATASPERPIDVNARRVWCPSVIVTNASKATVAKSALPATWVAVSTVSSRWRTPAVDHATAASAM
jgi:hypothetical protein